MCIQMFSNGFLHELWEGYYNDDGRFIKCRCLKVF